MYRTTLEMSGFRLLCEHEALGKSPESRYRNAHFREVEGGYERNVL
jgi:hypothetical protein